MSQNYFVCPRCSHVHDVDPRPDLASPEAPRSVIDGAEAKRRLFVHVPHDDGDLEHPDVDSSLSPAPATLKERRRASAIMRDVVDSAIHGDGHCIEMSREDLYKLGDQILAKVSALSPQPPTSDELLLLVDEFCGWWHLNREGSVNAAYDYIDKLVKRLERLEGSPHPPSEARK